MRLTIFALLLGVAAAAPGPTSDQHTFASDDVTEHPGNPFPKPPNFPPPSGRETIYETLSRDSRFSRIIKAIDYIEEVAVLLNDSTTGLTFFAPDNKALRYRPKQHAMSEMHFDDSAPFYNLDNVLSGLENLDQSFSPPFENDDDSDDDGDWKERKRRFFKMLLRAILEYHVLPRRLDVVSLGDKMTHPTHFVVDQALGGNPQRIRTEQKSLPPILVVNFYSHIVRPDIKASNGLIHVVDHPLLPPPSVFQELFMASSHFSIFVSAIQRTGLTNALDFRFTNDNDGGESRVEGTEAVTVFAPTNTAFEALPKDLRLFLFSPFGERALKKILQYHIVPEFVLHSDYTFNRTDTLPGSDMGAFDLDSELAYQLREIRSGDAKSFYFQDRGIHFADAEEDETIQKHKKHKKPKHPKKPKMPWPEPISLVDLTLPTLFDDHPLHVHIGKFKLRLPIPGHDHPYRIITKFSVDGHELRAPDLVAMNGAVHVINKLLDPRGPHHYQAHMSGSPRSEEKMDIWKTWKTWLFQWADL
ncbi:hypothetical protein APHAL10511_001358 [Amanita phalloides]|nr:hypothetical protein APHAL10511_001358 [Amanita phalloides]